MPYRKKLIEVALPLDAINAESAHEKSVPRRGHPATMHLWWARRPLATCRAVLFASLVDDPAEPAAPPAYLSALDALPKPEPLPVLWDAMTLADQRRERLFSFIARLVKWENSNDEQIIGPARQLINLACEGNPPPVLDPFCGGGSIPLEAQRLGLEAHASDLNPVAVLITKALIEIPPKFANWPPVNPEDRERLGGAGVWKGAAGLAADVRYYGKWMRDEAERRIGHLYPKAKLPSGGEAAVIAWLWARTVRCPNPACGAQMPLVRSFALSTKPGKKAWIDPIIDHAARIARFEVRTGEGVPRGGTVDRLGASCIVCGTSVPFEDIRAQGKSGTMGVQLMALVTEGRRQREYLSSSDEQETAAAEARLGWVPDTDLPKQALGFRVQAYGMTKHRDLFTPRQLMALATLSDLVDDARSRIRRDGKATDHAGNDEFLLDVYSDAVATYLAFAIDKLADWSSSLCSWIGSIESIKQTFSRQTLSMVWDPCETNPFSASVGNYANHVDWVASAIRAVTSDSAGDRAEKLGAADLVGEGDRYLVCTDPPYYDNVAYADLSDFFYIWLRRSLGSIDRDLFATVLTPKGEELVADPYRHGGRRVAKTFFEQGLHDVFLRLYRKQDPSYPLTVFYAFKQAEADRDEGDDVAESPMASTGWEAMLAGLLGAGLTVTGTWPMRTERSGGLREAGRNALASSIVLVCRPRPEDALAASRAEFLEELGSAMRSALPMLASGQVAPVDLAQASIGPGMAAYSKYSAVIRQDGRRVSVREALQDINNAIASYRSERVSSFDPETRFCLAWYEQYGYGQGAYGDADNLARAYNVGPEAMQRDGLLATGQGRLRLEQPASYPVGVTGLADRSFGGSAWEACLRLATTLEQEGETGAALLARELGDGAAVRARELAVWMYTIADAKKRNEDAFLFNALDASWGGIQAEIARRAPGEQSRF